MKKGFLLAFLVGGLVLLGLTVHQLVINSNFREAVVLNTFVMSSTALVVALPLWGIVWIASALYERVVVKRPAASGEVETDVDYRCAHALFTLMIVLLGEDFFGYHVKNVIAQPDVPANQRRFWTVIACIAIGYDALARLGHHHKRAMLNKYLLGDVLQLPEDTPVTTVALFDSAKCLLCGHGTVDDYAAAFAALRPTRLAGIFEELDYLRK